MYSLYDYLELAFMFFYMISITIAAIKVCKLVPLANQALRKYLSSNPRPDSYIYRNDGIKKVDQNQIS